jgi:carbamoyltransferase
MPKTEKPIYILGTGLSHDGATCLLKDGELLFAIEKERLSRKKHDGGNDLLTVKYCLDAAGIGVDDLSLVVQAANFEKDEIRKDAYGGRRYFTEQCKVPFVSISHHLAHAYSAIGTCPYDEFNVLIIDGCGSPYEQCDDVPGAYVPERKEAVPVAEKDSFYHYSGGGLRPLYKDFSEFDDNSTSHRMATTRHSIGGLYSLISNYVFGNMDDAGKLMGLAPYGNRDAMNAKIFSLENGRVFVNKSIFRLLSEPAGSYDGFRQRFSYFADVAAWVQKEVEEAILYTVSQRQQLHPHANLCYAGGVALNAVANARILRETGVTNLYMEPAAGDNGLALGCAYYGWLQVLKQSRKIHNGTTYLGRQYTGSEILQSIELFKSDHKAINVEFTTTENVCGYAARLLGEGKVVGWFQGRSEFGPRALGNRSILADGRKKGVRAFINKDIKMREDFRPFAPAVMAEYAAEYFEYAYESPYMILVDKVKENYRQEYEDVVHVDGSARVQTVTHESNSRFYSLLGHFRQHTGSAILLNTSLNKKGMPIVETPYEALGLFYESKMDVMVIHNHVFEKKA